MTISRSAGSTARAPQRAADNGFHHHYRGWWKQSFLRDVVVAVTLLAAVGAALSVGPFALELVAFH
jgi:hypothetical protein